VEKLETKGFNGLMEMAQQEAQKKENFGSDFNVSDTGDYYKLIAPFIYLCTYLEDKIILRYNIFIIDFITIFMYNSRCNKK